MTYCPLGCKVLGGNEPPSRVKVSTPTSNFGVASKNVNLLKKFNGMIDWRSGSIFQSFFDLGVGLNAVIADQCDGAARCSGFNIYVSWECPGRLSIQGYQIDSSLDLALAGSATSHGAQSLGAAQ
jgi:hypothetical protein